MNNTELKALANKFAKEFWGMEVNFPVYFTKLKGKRYGEYAYYYKRNKKRKVIGWTPKHIAISNTHSFDKPENRKQLESVLKHELCHWYCQQTGKSFSDGSKDFEAELLKRGAMSTHLNLFNEDNWEVSRRRQQETIEGRRNLMGSKDFEYVEEPLTEEEKKASYERKYKVYYNGVFIGKVKKWNWGKYRWNPESDHKEYKRMSWTARKNAVEDLLKVAKQKGLV
jgi:predicted SprT family Zn-dependent metalloprotease